MAYPYSDLPNDKTNSDPSVDDHPPHHNELADALNDLKVELGSDPKGGAANVTVRLDAVDSAITAAGSGAATALATHAADATSVHGIADTAALYQVGGTDVAVADGGTGASTAAAARTNLGLGTAATFASTAFDAAGAAAAAQAASQPLNADLTTVAARGSALQVLRVNSGGTALEYAAPAGGAPTGAAGGDLTGTYPNPTFAEDMATQAELAAAVLASGAAPAQIVYMIPGSTGSATLTALNATSSSILRVIGQVTLASNEVFSMPAGHDIDMRGGNIKVRGTAGQFKIDNPDSNYWININGNDEALLPLKFGTNPTWSGSAWVQGQGSKCHIEHIYVTQTGAGGIAFEVHNLQNSGFDYIRVTNNDLAAENVKITDGCKNIWIDKLHSSAFTGIPALHVTTDTGNQQTSKVTVKSGMSEGGYVVFGDCEDVAIYDYALNGGSSTAATTIASGSNGAALPQGTINVVSTASDPGPPAKVAFPTSGYLLINGTTVVKYTGVTGTTFTGCTLGTGTLTTGMTVVPSTHAVLLTSDGNRDTTAGPGDGIGNGPKPPSSVKLYGNQYRAWTNVVMCDAAGTGPEVHICDSTGPTTNLIVNSNLATRFYLGRDFGANGVIYSNVRYINNGNSATEATCVKTATYA